MHDISIVHAKHAMILQILKLDAIYFVRNAGLDPVLVWNYDKNSIESNSRASISDFMIHSSIGTELKDYGTSTSWTKSRKGR